MTWTRGPWRRARVGVEERQRGEERRRRRRQSCKKDVRRRRRRRRDKRRSRDLHSIPSPQFKSRPDSSVSRRMFRHVFFSVSTHVSSFQRVFQRCVSTFQRCVSTLCFNVSTCVSSLSSPTSEPRKPPRKPPQFMKPKSRECTGERTIDSVRRGPRSVARRKRSRRWRYIHDLIVFIVLFWKQTRF